MSDSVLKIVTLDRDQTLYDAFYRMDFSKGNLTEKAYVNFEGRLYPGIPAMLKALRKVYPVLALSSSASQNSALAFAQKFSLCEVFTNSALDGRSYTDILGKTPDRSFEEIGTRKIHAHRLLCEQYGYQNHCATHVDDDDNLLEHWAKQAYENLERRGGRMLAATLILQDWCVPVQKRRKVEDRFSRIFNEVNARYPGALSIAIVRKPGDVPAAIRCLDTHLREARDQGRSGGGGRFTPEMIQALALR
jgi:hypothetical protein